MKKHFVFWFLMVFFAGLVVMSQEGCERRTEIFNWSCDYGMDFDCDGTVDKNDKCYGDPGPAENLGCPKVTFEDSDGDGVVDTSDSCPTVRGDFDNGCPSSNTDYECMEDVDCGEKMECNSVGYCVPADVEPPPPECSSDGDCDSDFYCWDGNCIPENNPPPSGCASDNDCPYGQVCRSAVCVPDTAECTQNSDCNTGEVCVDGSCEDSEYCDADYDCPDSLICEDGCCVEPECYEDVDCPSRGDVCDNGRCEEGSVSDCRVDSSACSSGYYCGTDGYCYPEQNDDDCRDNSSLCAAGYYCGTDGNCYPNQSSGDYPPVAKSTTANKLMLASEYVNYSNGCITMIVFDERTTPYPTTIKGQTDMLRPPVYTLTVSTARDSDGYMTVDVSALKSSSDRYIRFSYFDCTNPVSGWAWYGNPDILYGMDDNSCVWCGTDDLGAYTCSIVFRYSSSGTITCAGNQ